MVDGSKFRSLAPREPSGSGAGQGRSQRFRCRSRGDDDGHRGRYIRLRRRDISYRCPARRRVREQHLPACGGRQVLFSAPPSPGRRLFDRSRDWLGSHDARPRRQRSSAERVQHGRARRRCAPDTGVRRFELALSASAGLGAIFSNGNNSAVIAGQVGASLGITYFFF